MKNQLLFITFLLTAAGAFAQLTVKPTAGGVDSYIYVKDQILFVKEGIALTKNPNATVEASIYLRDNGQLIQENAAAKNSGNGQLSVQQNTNPTNAYAYYYWCSPIGNPGGETATAAGNKNFGVSLLYDPDETIDTKADLVNTTSSHNGTTGTPITVSTRWLYTHPNPGTEAQSNYFRMYGDNNAKAGEGFTMKGVGELNPGHDQTYEFRGRPNNGDFEIPVDGPAGAHPDVNAMMTLTGNPFPSALDLNKVFYEPGNTKLSTIYYYDEDRTVMSHYYNQKPFGYGVWVPLGRDPYTNGVPDLINFKGTYTRASFFIWNAGGTQSPHPGQGINQNFKRFAPIGQGFMFVGNSNGNVIIKNTHRYYMPEGAANQSVFQRPVSVNEEDKGNATSDNNPYKSITYTPPVDTRVPQLRLYTVFDNALTRDMLLILSDETTDGYDRGYDGLSPGGMKSDVYFPITGTNGEKLPYVIQGTNYNVDKQIPISFKLNKQSKIDVRAVEEIKKPYSNVYLFDSQENTYRLLSQNQNLSIPFTLDAGTYENRFFIVFKKPEGRQSSPFTTNEEESKIIASVKLFQNNPAQQLQISNPEGYNLKSAAMYDMNGKMVIQKQNLGSNNTYTFYTGNLSEGVYLVKLTTAEDVIIDYKAIVSN